MRWVPLRPDLISVTHPRDEGCCRNKCVLDSWRMKHRGCCKPRATSSLCCSHTCKFNSYYECPFIWPLFTLNLHVLPEITSLTGYALTKLRSHSWESIIIIFLKVKRSLPRKARMWNASGFIRVQHLSLLAVVEKILTHCQRKVYKSSKDRIIHTSLRNGQSKIIIRGFPKPQQ